MPLVLAGRVSLLGAPELRFRACTCLGVDPKPCGGNCMIYPDHKRRFVDGLLSARPATRSLKTGPACRMIFGQAHRRRCCNTASEDMNEVLRTMI